MKYLFIGILVVIVGGLFVLFERGNESVPGQSELDRLAALTFVDLNGNDMSLAAFRGKPLAINSWAGWCPFCVEELPDLALLGEEFEGKVVVVAINRKESAEEAKAFLDSIGNPENIEIWLDDDDSFYRAIGAFTMPETLFLDRDGNVSLHKRGFMGIEEMREHTEAALGRENNSNNL